MSFFLEIKLEIHVHVCILLKLLTYHVFLQAKIFKKFEKIAERDLHCIFYAYTCMCVVNLDKFFL